MCGICGIIDFEKPCVDNTRILKSVHTLTHRGPDDFGIYQDGNCALGHRRLSIIDLATGHQPIHNEDSRIWIICNGEIYNYVELKNNLIQRGHVFYTKSDSEIIVHLYEEYGEKCVLHLNGIFAFALWDKDKKKLLLARDHLGVKPLFYYHSKNKFLFGSEIKAILKDMNVERAVNHEALVHFLSLNYIPTPLTIFKDIYALPAGHILTCADRKISLSKYWDVACHVMRAFSEEEAAALLRSEVEKSIQAQLVSDVPVGAFLSGGLDSSIVVSLMAERSLQKIKTFNVRFTESSYDESAYARMISRRFNTEHHEVFCRPEDYLQHVSDIIAHSDNLTVDISMLPLYLLAQAARREVKVILAGDGADELLAGYPTYAADKFARYYRRLPGIFKTTIIPPLVHRLPVSTKKMSFEFKAKRFVEGALLTSPEAHYSWRVIFSDDEKARLLSAEALKESHLNTYSVYQRLYEGTESWDELSRHQYADLKGWLTDSILAKVDFMSMAHALEVRVPFLNPRLVEFAFSIPSGYKLKYFTGKYILKKAFEGKIPSEILRRPKAGFNIPFGKWLTKELKPLMMAVLNEDEIRKIGVFNGGVIKELIADHLCGKQDNGYKILGLLHFCLWHKTYIQR